MKFNKTKIIQILIFGVAIVLVSSCKEDKEEIKIENNINFNSTITYDSINDFDGNYYKTITIGNQVWMAENLKTTHYSDGSAIPNTIDNFEWVNSKTGEYCWMNNDIAEYKNNYGALYNYYAVVDSRNLCPTGWHVPSFYDLAQLVEAVGGDFIAGVKLKETGIKHWMNTNNADNSSGFTALPGGGRGVNGNFSPVGSDGYWWLSTAYDQNYALNFNLSNNSDTILLYKGGKILGFSVRCIRGSISVKTALISDIKQNTATSGGNILSEEARIIERGVCWSTNHNPTIADNKTSDGNGIGVYASCMTNLQSNTIYYVRAFATNGSEIFYGNELSFTTKELSLPVVSTNTVSDPYSNAITTGGNVSEDGGLTVTLRGVCWSTSPNPTNDLSTKTANGEGLGAFTSNITGLTENTVYYIRAFATNSKGTAYGNEINFTTPFQSLPIVTSYQVTIFGSAIATCGGKVDYCGLPITARGVCWSTSPNPSVMLSTKTIDGEGIGTFVSSINGIIPNTTYYVRAYATNSLGTAYGNEVSFKSTDKVYDIDGNVYNTINIGSQVWMAENLKTTKYRNGSSIPNITDNTVWANQTTGAYCWYDNDISKKDMYGALYNYFSVVDTRNLCPTSWHIPSFDEWNTLTLILGGSSIAGGKLKEIGFTNWLSPNVGATNESGFNGLPGGYRLSSYANIGSYGYFWSQTNNISGVWFMRLNSNDSNSLITHVNNKAHGFSVRCLKDQ